MKIKFLITLLICYIPFTGYACRCASFENTSSQYQEADFVGLVKILKTYKNDVDSIDKYRVDVKTITLIKGESINGLVADGYNEVPGRWSSCSVGFNTGSEYIIYGKKNTKDGKIYVYYCGVSKYNNDRKIEILKILKRFAKNISVDTRWGRTTYIPSQLYMRYNPDSARHLSLIKVKINKRTNKVKVKHLTRDDDGFKSIIKEVFANKVNWQSKLNDTYYPKNKYTFVFELNPYTSSKYLREKGYLLN
jgi:hypothetical protein